MKQGITFWILLLLPTVVLGIGTLWLVQREADRLEDNLTAFREARIASLDQRAETVAANLLLSFEEIREALMDTLAEAPADRLEQALGTLPDDNPFVRASGLWRTPDGFVVGTLNGQATELPWEEGERPLEEPAPQERLTQQQAFARGQVQTRRELDNIARGQSFDVGSESDAASPAAPGRRQRAFPDRADAPPSDEQPVTGWDWVSDDQELRHWGWMQSQPAGEVRVLELDTTFLHTNLQRLLPDDPDVTWTLTTGASAMVTSDDLLQGEALLGSDLPGWRVTYASAAREPVLEVTAFRWLSSALVLGITLSIGIGGLLLRWQLTAAERDARTKTTFLTNVSHELKTPLSAIQLYVEMLDEGKIHDDAKRQRYVKTIRSETGRLGRLVANLLDQSRLDRDPEFRLNLVPLDPAAHLHDFLQQRAPEIRAAGMQLTTRINTAEQGGQDGSGGVVRIDPDAFDQILSNLLDNAVRYAGPGKQLDVEAEADTQANRYLIRVMDRGPGVPPAFRSSLFTPFTRSESRLERPQTGLGVGLSIARGLARRMDGDLQYTPRLDGGASFTLSFPLHAS